MEPTFLAYDSKEYPLTPQQDYANLPRQQEGLRSAEFRFMRLSAHVEGLISNYQRIIDGYLAGLPRDTLAELSSVLGGGFDGPILNRGAA